MEEGGTSFPRSPAGIVLIADIEDFSLMKSDYQEEVVNILWRFVEEHDLIADAKAHEEVALNTTGDGILVAFSRNNHVVDPEAVLRFADDLIKTCAAEKPSTKVRIGIHQGPFARLEALGGIQVVGTAANECARIVSIGDGGQIVCSNALVRAWHDKTEGVMKQFDPEDVDHPYEFFVKHDVPARIHLFKRGGKHSTPSRRIARLDAVAQRLHNRLREVEEGLVDALTALDHNLSREQISARISLLGYRKHENVLATTDYRYHFQKLLLSRSNTKYRLRPKPQGPPGKAFRSQTVQVERGLPDYDEKPTAYIDILKKRWNIPRKMITDTWQRCARSFIGIPLGIAKNVVDAVICIDMKDPLASISEPALRKVALKLQARHAEGLSEVWALRIQG